MMSTNVDDLEADSSWLVRFAVVSKRTFKKNLVKSLCEIFSKMILMTMVARVADGLPLTASIQEDEQVRIFDLSKKSCQIVVLN